MQDFQRALKQVNKKEHKIHCIEVEIWNRSDGTIESRYGIWDGYENKYFRNFKMLMEGLNKIQEED